MTRVRLWSIVLPLLVVNFVFSSLCWAKPQFLNTIADSRQVVHVHSISGNKGVLDYWEADEQGKWHQSSKRIAVNVGSNGAVSASSKQEGDGRTPQGLYALGLAFGYEPLSGVKMPYKVLTENDFWVDEPTSPAYNTLVNAKPKSGSYEVMRRSDHQYSLGVVVEYNTKPVVAYKGSAIFLHVCRSPTAATAGCIAMDKETLRELLLWLEPEKKPLIMIE